MAALNLGEHGPFFTEKMVRCPLNPDHLLRYTRLQYHLVKCKKNFPNGKIITCPYNATHLLLPPKTLEHHLEICPDKNSILSYKYRMGYTGLKDHITPVQNRDVFSKEDWSHCNSRTYDPSKKLKKVDIKPSLKLATKSEKRNYSELLKKTKSKEDPRYPGVILSDSEDEEDGSSNFSDFFGHGFRHPKPGPSYVQKDEPL